MHELKKTIEHHVFIAMKFQRPQNDLLGQLIEENDEKGQQPDSLILSE